MSIKTRLTALEKATGWGSGPGGTVEVHAIYGNFSPNYRPCDRREEHGAECVFRVVARNRSGTRFMRLYGFDPDALD